MKAAVGLAAAVMVSACSDPNADTHVLDDLKPNWTRLADGSSFATVAAKDSFGTTAVRCWPVSAGGFDCISANRPGAGLDMLTISKDHEEALPEIVMGSVPNADGYSCEHVLEYREQVAKGGNDLISNTPDYNTAVWTRSHVNTYMAENHVEGPKWYRCLDILEDVATGSLETLGTTSVTPAMAGIATPLQKRKN